MARTHLVLVPGFGGFDAFGELRYYAGVTRLLSTWRAGDASFPPHTHDAQAWTVSSPEQRAELTVHYFDNHPTAGVATRARLLRTWLAKLVARGTVGPSDTITLVGHSTGGLDIRALLHDLHTSPPGLAIAVDGAPEAVPIATLRDAVRRVVFLSTPQHGTNIADFVRAHPAVLRAILVALDAGVTAATQPLVATLAARLVSALPLGLGPLAADTVVDLAKRHGRRCRWPRALRVEESVALAEAQEAYAEVKLWLDRAQADFLALDTLAVERGTSAAVLACTVPPGVKALTFATIGRDVTTPLPRGGLWRLPDLLRVVGTADPGSDVLYRLAWAITCVGPLQERTLPNDRRTQPHRAVISGREVKLQHHHNDGIANTAAMVWENEPVRLVEGDHGDIMGHFAVSPEPLGPWDVEGRYDLFVSGSGFTVDHFVRVWREVLDFGAGG